MAATGSGHGLAAGVTALPMRLGKDPATHPFNIRFGCNDGPPPDGSSTSVNRFRGHAVKGQASAPRVEHTGLPCRAPNSRHQVDLETVEVPGGSWSTTASTAGGTAP